jgi:hypothetical protein
MPKSRTRSKAQKRKKVYTHHRPKKKDPIRESDLRFDQLQGVIDHSKEIIKLKILRKRMKQDIAIFARCRDNMSHFITEDKERREWLLNRIKDHEKACSTKIKIFLGGDAEKYEIPDDFHLGSTDLKNGYVAIEKKETKELVAVILSPQTLTNIVPHNEEHLKMLQLPNLLKTEDVMSAILSTVVSQLENTISPLHICVSATCMDRKPKINFEDL